VKPIFDVLERHGLIRDADALTVQTFDPDRVMRIYEDVHKTILEDQNDQINEAESSDPFKYVASASLRGDSACSEVDCRLSKIDFLNRFAALYATEVAVPLSLRAPDKMVSDPEYAAVVLSRSVLTLLRCRPLIEAGIVRPTLMSTRHCVHDIDLVRDMSESARDYAFLLAQEHASQFEAIYQTPEKSPSGKSTVYLSGPRDFLEHDMVFLFDESDSWRLKSWRYGKEGKVMLRGPRKLEMIASIFDTIASNTSFYLAYGLRHEARLLTDLPGEAILLEDLSEDEEFTANTRALRELTHSLPLLDSLSMSAMIKIRREDRESFAAYRYEIASITAEALTSGLSEAAAQEMLRMRVTPRVNKIRQEMRLERSKQIKYLGFGVAAVAASVGIGACGLPMLAAVPLITTAAALGTRLLGKGGELAVESLADVKQKNELYFLVRLLEEAQ
jgi:hypothetical protein